MMNMMSKMTKCFLAFAMMLTMIPSNVVLAKSNVRVNQENDETVTLINFDTSNQGTSLSQIDFKGGWEYEQGIASEFNQDGFYRKGYDENNTNHGFNFKFEGNKVEFYGVTEPIGGKLSVKVDGVAQGEFDYYSAEKQHQQKVIIVDGLSDGVHTLEARFVGKNTNSTGYGCYVDFAKVYKTQEHYEGVYTLEVGSSYQLPFNLPEKFIWASDDACVTVNNGVVSAVSVGESIVTATKEQEQYKYKISVAPKAKYDVVKINDNTLGTGLNQFHYIGDWGRDENLDVLYQRDGRWTSTSIAPDTCGYEIKFKGDKIRVYGNLEPNLGIADFYIDGRLVATKDLYHQGSKLYQQLQFESTLLDASVEHTLKVMMTGEKNQAAGGNAGYVDFVEVYTEATDIYPTAVALPETIALEVGDERALALTFTPSNTNVKELTWNVADPEILDVVDNKIVAKKAGSTTVSVSAKTEAGTLVTSNVCSVRVKEGNMYFHGSYGTTNKTYFKTMYDELKAEDPIMNNQVTAWRGDRAYSEIVLLTKGKDYTNVKVKASAFTNENKDVIAAENVKPSFLKYTKAARNGLAGPNGTLTPDVIYGDTMTLDLNTVAPVWVEMNVPKTAKPGIYTGTISVCDQAGKELIAFTQRIEVLDVVQPSITEQGSYYLELWNYVQSTARYYNVELLSEEHLAILKPHLQQYRDNAGKTVMATICEEPWNHQTYDDSPSMVKWTKKTDGTFAFDYTLFDKYAQFVFDNNLAENISCYSIVPWGNRIAYYDEATKQNTHKDFVVGNEEWRSVWGSFLTSFKDHLDAHGWFDHVWIAMDERGESDMQHAIDLIKTIPNKDGHTFKISGAFNRVIGHIWEQMYHVSPNINSVLSYGADRFRALADARKQEGLITTMYTCTGNRPNLYNLYDPCEAAWTIWMGENLHTDGYMRWAYDAWVEDPLNDASHRLFETGDVQMVYPGERADLEAGKVPVTRSAPRTERLYEAIRDVQKLRYLKEANPMMADDIDAFIAGIKNFNGSANTTAIAQEMDRVKEGVMQFTRNHLTGNRTGNTATNATLENPTENDARAFINDGDLSTAWTTNGQAATFKYDGLKDVHSVVVFVKKNTDMNAISVKMIDDQNREVPVYNFEKVEGMSDKEKAYDVYEANFIGLVTGFKVEVKQGNDVTIQEVMTFENHLTKLNKKNMSITATSQETTSEDGKASNMIDDNNGTIWHTKYSGGTDSLPFTIVLDLGDVYTLDQLEFVPRQNGNNGIVTRYDLFIATEKDQYVSFVENGTWQENAEAKTVNMNDTAVRYVKLVVKGAVGGFGSMAEINAYKKANAEDMNLARARQFVELAETSKQAVDVQHARTMVALLKDSTTKTELMNRLDAIEKTIKMSYYSISLKENICLNFYLSIDSSILNDQQAYVLFTREDQTTISYPMSDMLSKKVVMDQKEYYKVCVPMAARQMNDSITAKAVLSDGSEIELGTYSIYEYAKTILQNVDGKYSKAAIESCQAMLNYGASAQTYFGYKQDQLVNDGLHKEYETVTQEAFAPYAMQVSGEVAGMKYGASNLRLLSEVALRHHFKVTPAIKEAYQNGTMKVFLVLNDTEKELTPTFYDNDKMFVEVENIYAEDYDQTFRVEVRDLTNNTTLSVNASVFSYANEMFKKQDAKAETFDIVKAMYVYNKKAKAYKNSLTPEFNKGEEGTEILR